MNLTRFYYLIKKRIFVVIGFVLVMLVFVAMSSRLLYNDQPGEHISEYANLFFVNLGIVNSGNSFRGFNILGYLDISSDGAFDISATDISINFKKGFIAPDFHYYQDTNENNELDAEDLYLDGQVVSSFPKIKEGDDNRDVRLTRHRFFIVSNKISNADFYNQIKSAEVNVTGFELDGKTKTKNIKAKIYDFSAISELSLQHDFSQLQRQRADFILSGSDIIIASGSHLIDEIIVVPRGYTLKIQPGALLMFADGASLVSYSPIIANGTSRQPIRFQSLGAAAWGVVAVLDASGESSFDYCFFSGGGELYRFETFMSGMLSVYQSQVRINNCEFSNAWADDSLNVKRADAVIKNSKFINNSADGIDFDFVKQGEISSSIFKNNGNDGIDFSGSTVLIKGNYIEKSGDKCISIGERSINSIIFNNTLNGCNIGVEVKDLSDVSIINNVIVNNKIGINAYQKKEIFGGGQARIYNSIIYDNDMPAKTDDQSTVEFYFSDIDQAVKGNNNFNLQPEFRDVDKDDFYLSSSIDSALLTSGNREILVGLADGDMSAAPIGLFE